MAAPYSRSVTFSTAQDVVCVRIPCPFRGRLLRLTVTQVGGSPTAGVLRIYDRKGASSVATDLNVRVSGAVDTVTADIGGSKVTFADTHGLYVGEEFEVKGCDVAAYNTTHLVLAVLSPTEVVSVVAHTGDDGAGGLWQIKPFMPTYAPITHLVLQEEIYKSNPLYRFDLDRQYENRDNQDATARMAYDALWLEFTPEEGAAAADWELGFTIEPASFIS